MSWTFSVIKQKVRALTGRRNTSEFTDNELESYINRYYQYQFPLDVQPFELQTFFEFDTTADQDEYFINNSAVFSPTFESEYVQMGKLAYIDGFDIQSYIDPEEFYDKWPETSTYDASRPTDVLYYDDKMIFRPTPDDTYEFKIQSWRRPAAFSADSDVPRQQEWGILIAYGASIQIVEDMGDVGRSLELLQAFTDQQTKMLTMTSLLMSPRKKRGTF